MKYLLRKCEIFADANVGKFISVRPTAIIQYSFVPRIIPFASPGNTVPMATFAGAPGGASLRFIYSFVLRAPTAPAGHLPRWGEVYMGRLINRPYRNYSLFISEAASLFNIHLFPRIIPVAPSGNTVPKATFAGVHRTPLRAVKIG